MRGKLFYLSSAVLLLTVLAMGCGQQAAKVAQNNSSPVGSISGQIYDQDYNTPIAGARAYVLVNGGYQIATANAQGAYTLGNLPLGAAYMVTYTANNYATPIYNVNLNVNASQFPQGNAVIQQNVGMFQLAASISGTVYDGINVGCGTNTPIGKVQIVLDLRNIGPTGPLPANFVGFDMIPTATTAASNGTYILSNLPGSIFGLNIPGPGVYAYYISSSTYYTDNSGSLNLYSGATTIMPSLCVR
ncbi:MAG: carboxypeptidase-like regulatory domain-containing protein [Deltaproteobacteria bacterium]|nr:carboxypeptidase-like regulatory domain-containing protein [Deltaproteobacteria bacterium]